MQQSELAKDLQEIRQDLVTHIDFVLKELRVLSARIDKLNRSPDQQPPNHCLQRRQREVVRPCFHVNSRNFKFLCDLFCMTSFSIKLESAG